MADEQKPKLWVTPAPPAYDGFGTETLVMTGVRTRGGNEYRVIEIQPDAEWWQRGRYGSGMYPCISVEEYDEWVRLGLA